MVLLAKITPPVGHRLLARPRFCKRLAGKGHPGATWVVGPPGAGKTSLAVGYLQEREGARLWFQADADDGDPAAFFAALSEAFRLATHGVLPGLLVFGPEYNQNLLTFARRYFEGLFASLPAGSVLVLDNYQEIPVEALVHDMLREGLSVLPPGLKVLVLSRQPPPVCFARLQVNGQLEHLTWDDFRMTDREALALLRLRAAGRMDAERAADLCRLAHGWPAGLVLGAAGAPCGPARAGALGQLLDEYFASEVFGSADPELRSLLLQVAVMPSCTAAQAQELTGLERAGARLEALARAGFFTVAHGEVDPVFEFHPLFREFLLHQAAAMPAETWNALRSRAAELLEQSGQVLEAFELHRARGAVDQQIRIIIGHAPVLLGGGQHQTLLALLASLPAGCTRQVSWLELWSGIALMSADLQESRVQLERAFIAFGREGNLGGQMLAWSSVVDTWLYAMDDYHSMDSWIEWLDQHQDAFERVEDPTLREAVAVSMTWAIMHRQPDHPHILKWVKETERILGEGFHPQIRLRAGTVAMFFHFLSGDQAACDVLLHRIHALADALREPMAILTSYWAETLVLFWTQAVPGHCREVVERGLALGERYGIHFYDYWFHGLDVVLDISAGKLERARGGLESLAPTVCGHHAQALYQLVISWLDFARGDLSAAAAHAELSVREAASCGQIFIQGLTRVLLADLKLEMGCLEEAQVQSGLAEALVRRVPNPILEIPFHLGAARQALAGFPGEPGPALEHVRRAMALEREYGGTHYHQLWGKPAWTTVVCLTALEHGIETAFALRTIRRHGLRPTAPPVHCQAWPWEIRITTLGQFSIQRNDQLLVFPVKVPWKVLLMLKALIAGGPGGVTEARIADGLWPDIDGDTARKSLDTTLHRLRQLLGLDGIITLRDGWLSLDPYRCWVDAHAFELLLASSPASQSAIDLYRGEFLGDLDQIWAVAYRERLRDGYVRGVLAQGHQCEIRSDFSGAIEWYEKGLEAAPQAELLYRRSMVCHRANGSRTEALRVFERCCMMLKATLDIDPSRETLHLASTLREAQPGR